MPQPKIFASVHGYLREPAAPAGRLAFTLDWTRLTGPVASGKFSFVSEPIVNERQLEADMREVLAAHLATLYPNESFTARDIVGGLP